LGDFDFSTHMEAEKKWCAEIAAGAINDLFPAWTAVR
jgi:hypothetical protein